MFFHPWRGCRVCGTTCFTSFTPGIGLGAGSSQRFATSRRFVFSNPGATRAATGFAMTQNWYPAGRIGRVVVKTQVHNKDSPVVCPLYNVRWNSEADHCSAHAGSSATIWSPPLHLMRKGSQSSFSFVTSNLESFRRVAK